MPWSQQPGCWEQGDFSGLLFLSPQCVWMRVFPTGYEPMAVITTHAYLVSQRGSKSGRRAINALPLRCPTAPPPLPRTGLSAMVGRSVLATPGNLRSGRPHGHPVALLTRSPSVDHSLHRKSLLPRRMLGAIPQTASCKMGLFMEIQFACPALSAAGCVPRRAEEPMYLSALSTSALWHSKPFPI